MITYPTLYSRDSLKNIRLWYMEQQDEKYHTVSGIIDGELVTSAWTIAKSKNAGKKNETSASQQATAEINARYKKQRRLSYFDDIKEVDQVRFVKPILAEKYKDYVDEINLKSKEWLLQIKFNGNRCIATKEGLFTRTGKVCKSCPHIHESLKEFFVLHPDAVLDGELFNYDLRQQLNEISKLIRKTVNISQENLKQSKKLICYYIYDGYNFGFKKEDPYIQRKEYIDKHIIDNKNLRKVEDFSIESKEDLDKHYKDFLYVNHEGAMLRHKNMIYEHKRSKYLLKMKPEDDDEAEIVNIFEGEGNWSGCGKIIKLKWKNEEFDATFKGTYEEAAEFLNNKNQWIGKTVTFLYNGLTGLGIPNYARMDIKNCIKTDR